MNAAQAVQLELFVISESIEESLAQSPVPTATTEDGSSPDK
jgi:hypothetical protein